MDDNAAITTLDGGTGDDSFQIGQIYGLQRDGKAPPDPRPLGDTSGGSLVTPSDLFPQLANSLTPQSIYGTVATTRGWLSAGATSPLLAQGGQGNDTFTVYSNQAAVRLEGDDGNDLFTVRAFALAETINTGTPNEEIDWIDPEKMIARPKLTAGFSTAAETDIRTGAGNNQVEYNINAPVSVDGGNGFDKLVILGTEFADHIVVTEKGIFGAGLTVTYQNIEVLEVDALEGDDTIDVLSTQPGVATRVIGGLGNDQINVAGDVAGEVVSRDIEGTSGVINNRVSSDDPNYDNRPADGIDVSVARGTQGQVIIDESGGASDGFTEVREDGTQDSYRVYLAKAPTSTVYVTVSGAMSPQEEHGNDGYLNSGDIVDNLGTGDSLLVSETPVDYDRDVYIDGTLVHIPKRSIVLVFDQTNWDIGDAKTVYVSAVDDSLAEGDRTVTISHSVLSEDPRFNHAIVRNVEATVIDNDLPGMVITQLDTNNPAVADGKTIVLEGQIDGTHAVNDLYSVQLTIAPAAGQTVTVSITLNDSEAVLSSYDGPTSRFQEVTAPTANDPGVYSLTFDDTNWSTPFRVGVAARYDSAPEDPHNTTITHSIDTGATTDTTYATTPVLERRVDARVIDDENPGLFLLESGGRTLVSAGDAQTGPGTGDSYTLRLNSAPSADVRDALITDGQTDIVADPGNGIDYAAIGDLQEVSLFDGNISISGMVVTRAPDSNLGSWLDDGFAPGMRIRIEGLGDFQIAAGDDAVTAQALTLTTAPAAGPYSGVAVNQLVERGLYTGSVQYDAAAKPFLLYAGDVTVSGGNTVTRDLDGSFIDDGFAVGQTITFGDGSGDKYVISSFAVDGHSMTVTGGLANGAYTSVNKMLGTLTRTDGTSWLDSGFLEGQIFRTSTFGTDTFKVDLITGSADKLLDVLVISDPYLGATVVPSQVKLITSGSDATMTVTQWAAVATFTTADWFTQKTIQVVADPGYDIQPGHENFRMFPKVEHRLDGIRGPLLVEGGPTSADRSLAEAIMLPGENNGPHFAIPPQPPESMSIDTLNIYDDGSHQDLSGTLTSTALTGFNMGGDLDFTPLLTPGLPTFGEPGVYPGGISFGSISLDDQGNFTTDGGRSTIEVLNIMLGEGNDHLEINGTLVPGPDHDPLTGMETTVSTHGGITAVHGGGNALLQVNGQLNYEDAALARVDGLAWNNYGFKVGQRVVLSTPSGDAAFTVTGFGDQPGGTGSVMLLGGGSAPVANQTSLTGFAGSVAVVDDLSVSGDFTVGPDRIIRDDNLPWQNLGFAIGQQVAFTSGGVTNLYTITDFDNNGMAGLGSAMLLSGVGLPAVQTPMSGTVAVASRNYEGGTFDVTTTQIARSAGTWGDAGFAAGQTIAVSGQKGTLLVDTISQDGMTLTVKGGTIATTGDDQNLLIGIVRVGGDEINVNAASAVFTGSFDVSDGRITRSDGTTWDDDLKFAIGQQITVTAVPNGNTGWLTIGNEPAAQLVVTGFDDGGNTLLVSGTPLSTGSFAATVVINSPLVVYGDTSQDAVWYKGKNDKLSLGKFSNKPMQHEDDLPVSFGETILFAGSQFENTFGTITRSDGSWWDSGFVPEGLIMVDDVLVGTISQISDDGKTLFLFEKDLTTDDDLSALWDALEDGAHTIVQRNRLGQNTDFFVFPLASAYLHAGNDVIDAHNLYAAIPDGQLPAVGFTAYGGKGDDLIIGSQAGDHLAGGSGNDTILGGRGIDLIYGDAGFNVDLITRELHVAKAAGSSGAKNLDPLFAGQDLIYGDVPGSTVTNVYSDYDDIIIGDHGLVTQDAAGARDTTKPAPALPQDLQTTLRARKIETLAPDNGADDQLYGNGGQDVLLGGTGNDAIDGGVGMDLILGDHASLDRTSHLDVFASLRFETLDGTQIYSTAPDDSAGSDMADNTARLDPRGDPEGRVKQVFAPVWGDYVITEVGHTKSAEDAIAVYRGNDYIAGGEGDDTILGELGADVIQGDGSIDFIAYRHEYDETGAVVVTSTARGRVGASRGADGAYLGGESTGTLTWYASYDSPGTDGHDYVEAGGGNDVVFGNQGQDDIVGGSSDFFGKTDGVSPAVLSATDPLGRPDGGDILFGGSGTRTARNDIGAATIDDTTQVITTTAMGHADDSDMILGDNGDIIRVLRTAGSQTGQWTVTPSVFETFNYDDYGSVKIVPRAARLLDYTPGGPNYDTAAWNDIGGNDEVHAESGDDFVYGGRGDDRLYGDGQDDDLIGGWGNDWISGGTGQDGVIGDDGRVFTSRNSVSADPNNAGYLMSLGEPLYGIQPLGASDLDAKNTNGDVLNEFIYTPGSIQTATINVSGALKKTVDITPFSSDPGWDATADEYGIAGKFGDGTGGTGSQPLHVNDDIIFGGLGDDWLHGGTGDDAISGAEALPVAAAGTPADNQPASVNGVTGVVVVDGLTVSGFLRPYNPGDILHFNPVDVDGQHSNRTRAGEFALYDEYNPLRKIVVAASADATQTYEFLLNFNESEGIVRPEGDTNPTKPSQNIHYGPVNDDGADAIFGDLGNDWIVGGTGKDDVYGGMGNDLLNVDDNHNSTGDLLDNNIPDTHPFYEDRAYGGAGRDVLIGNTGGDRLIDWTGEYNSYLVPFAPFGMGTVSRTLQPQLPEFLYALSFSDGADATRYSDVNNGAAPPAPSNHDPIPSRNGEPAGELGLVLQKDEAWQDQHGGPADPQAGNIPGGKKDVLRTADFSDNTAGPMTPQTGSWTVSNGRLQVAPDTQGGDAVSLLNTVDVTIPDNFEYQATINAVKPTGGYKANAYLVFDYYGPEDFKFAGVNVSTNKLEVGHRDASGWIVDAQSSFPGSVKSNTDYVVWLSMNGSAFTMQVGKTTLSYAFAPRVDADGISHGLAEGMVGLGANNALAQIDNVILQSGPKPTTLEKTADFSAGPTDLFQAPLTGTWQTTTDYRYLATAAGAGSPAVDLMTIAVTPGSVLDITTTLKTWGQGGVVFDYQSPNYFKFATLSADGNQVLIGHRTGSNWVIDESHTTKLNAGADYKLEVLLRGTTVNVKLNGVLVASHVYNNAVTDNGYGLLSMQGSSSGQTSFDNVNVKTDDAQYAAPALTAASVPAQPASGATADAADLNSMLAQAEQNWVASGLVTTQDITALGTIDLELGDLQGLTLSEADAVHHAIIVDADAAGWGWFVDTSPASSSEFRVRLDSNVFAATPDSSAFGRMDLLTAMEHELGHLLGFDHTDAGAIAVMREDLDAGARYELGSANTIDDAPQPAATVPSAPAFDRYAGYAGPAIYTGIDWQANASEDWDIKLSPYDTGKPAAKSASNLAPFNFELLAKQSAGKQGAEFDSMGRALLGKDEGR